jgi:hypothetical protein
MLVIEKEHDPKRPDAPDRNCFGCHTCPYIFPVEKQVRPAFLGLIQCPNRVGQYAEREKLERKQVDDVIGGKEAWKNAPRAQGASLILVRSITQLTARNSHVSKV